MAHIMTTGETMALLTPTASGRLRHATHLALGAGGAESTVAIALSRLGLSSTWISRLGGDELGLMVLNRIRGEGVNTTHVILDKDRPTGLYIKEQSPAGTRAHYYRRGSAASALAPGAFDPELLLTVDGVHLSGITAALSDTGADYVRWVASQARARSVPVSFDVNFRAALWSSETAREYIDALLPLVDILFISQEEAQALWPEHDPSNLLRRLAGAGPREVLFKRGPAGCMALVHGREIAHPGFEVAAVEATGAGDAFAAGYLAGRLWQQSPPQRLITANAMGAFNVLGGGDYETLPSRDELTAFIEAHGVAGA